MEAEKIISGKKDNKIAWFVPLSLILHLLFAILFTETKKLDHSTEDLVEPVFVRVLDNLPYAKSTNLPEITTSDVPKQKDNKVQPAESSILPIIKDDNKKTKIIEKKNIDKPYKISKEKNIIIPPVNIIPEKNVSKLESIKSRREMVELLRSKRKNTQKTRGLNLKDNIKKEKLPFWGEKEQQTVAKNFIISNKNKKDLTDHISINTADLMYTSYMMKLGNKISMTWRYPVVAQEFGWGGDVLVGIIINSNGHVKDIEILDSSGHKVLDDEVVSAIKRAAPFDKFPNSWKINKIGVSKSLFKSKKLISQLLQAGIIQTDEINNSFFIFHDSIDSEQVLIEKVKEAKIKYIEHVVSIWNNYGKLLAIHGRFRYKNNYLTIE